MFKNKVVKHRNLMPRGRERVKGEEIYAVWAPGYWWQVPICVTTVYLYCFLFKSLHFFSVKPPFIFCFVFWYNI